MKALALLLLAGCHTFATVSRTNAPGLVDLDQPMAREDGSLDRFEPSSAPGIDVLTIIPTPYLGAGMGRDKDCCQHATGELGLEVRVERAGMNRIDIVEFPKQSWGVTAGLGIVQWNNQRSFVGPLYAELNYRFLAGVYPIDVGLGPAVYGGDLDVGAQLSLRVAAMFFARTRYLANSGAELLAGLSLPFPLVFGTSR